jgi:hypothetical protein
MSMKSPKSSLVVEAARVTVPVLLLALFSGNSWAELRFREPAVNLGEVRTGKPLTHTFTYVNAGSDVLEITDARASCGCLTPRLDKQTLQAGEEGALVLEINTLSQPAGKLTWRVQLGYRSGNASYEAALLVSAQVVAEVMVQPSAVAIYADHAIGHDILLTDVRPRALAISEVRTSSPELKAELAGEFQDAAKHRVRKIRLGVTENYPTGRHTESVAIFTDDPDYRELKVPVTVIKQARQRIAVSPNQVTLVAPTGQPIPSRVLLVRDIENQQVAVDQVVGDHPAIRCQWAQGPAAMATVKIVVDRTGVVGGVLQSNVHIHVRAPNQETLTVPVTCTLQ